MYPQTQSSNNLPANFLQFHENAFVSPLNLINVTHPAPISFGRAPHFLQQITPRVDPSAPHLQSIDANKLQMYQFLAQRKIKEDRRKQELNEKNAAQQKSQQRNIRSAQSQQPSKGPPVRSKSAPKKSVGPKKDFKNQIDRPQVTPTPPPIHFTRPTDPYSALSTGKQNEIADIHEQLLIQLRILHNPRAKEHVIDETEQEKQRRIRLKRERIKRDSRAVYNAHQELKQILNDMNQTDANFPRLIHRHLNAYKAILLATETLANEAPLKSQDAPVQQLFAALIPVLETLTHANQALGLSYLCIEPSLLQDPPSKVITPRPTPDNHSSPSNRILPSIYQELMKKKQQRKQRVAPSVLRPRSAEATRLPRTRTSSVGRPTISAKHKMRARSHSPLPSIRSASTIETPFYSRFTVDHILVKLAPRLLANYTGHELSEQIERARTVIPMFLVDNRLSEDDIVDRVVQMLIPRQEQQQHRQNLESTTGFDILETPEERKRRVNLDVYQTQISTWEDEMSQIRQRLQNYRTNRLEQDTNTRRTVRFQNDPVKSPSLPENVHIHTPHHEYTLDDFVTKSYDNKQAFEQTFTHPASRGGIHLQGLDSGKIRQIERYRKDFQHYLERTEHAKNQDFDPCQIINRLSEFLLDEALLTVVNEVETLTVELSQKLVENELLGGEVSLADVEKTQQKQHQQRQHQQPYRRPAQHVERKNSSASPSERYTSSFEEDINTESKVSRSEDEEHTVRRQPIMEGTGRFTTTAFQQRTLPKNRLSSSTSSSSSSPTNSPKAIIIKPTVVVKKPSPTYEDNQFSDRDVDSSTASRSRGPQKENRYQMSVDEDEDDDLLVSLNNGEKIYSADYEEASSKHRSAGIYDDDDEDDDDAADTMKLSARSFTAAQRRSFDSDAD